ncbi:hypothetical protein GCK32_011352 [Trichostrongylus colubriformis]|uniref:Uncharacterized protein n=1 Tax=Trichostrongylus colubriformis TaxID=6319 RepID=A0AAN8FCH3_TRICO
MKFITCILTTFLLLDGSVALLRCGNDDIQQGIARSLLVNDCKGRMGKIDACCVAHTNCYENRAPMKVCDDTFCKCIQDSAKKKPTCMFHAANFCAVARAFGVLQYNKLRPQAQPPS